MWCPRGHLLHSPESRPLGLSDLRTCGRLCFQHPASRCPQAARWVDVTVTFPNPPAKRGLQDPGPGGLRLCQVCPSPRSVGFLGPWPSLDVSHCCLQISRSFLSLRSWEPASPLEGPLLPLTGTRHGFFLCLSPVPLASRGLFGLGCDPRLHAAGAHHEASSAREGRASSRRALYSAGTG